MCGGPSRQQVETFNAQMDFYNTMTTQARTVFGNALSVFDALNRAFAPIVAAGPNQEGFSPEEKTALMTQATEGTGQTYAHAAKALGEQVASQGGGNLYIPSGANDQLKEELLSSAAANEAAQKTSIIAKDYDIGRQNFYSAAGILGGATGTYNPATGMATSATGAGSAASQTANEITQANNSWMNMVGSVLGGIGGSVVSGGMSNLGSGVGFFGQNAPAPGCWVAAAYFDGWLDPRTIAVRHWIFNVWAKRSLIGKYVSKLYMKVGERVSKVPLLVTMLGPLFEVALKRAKEEENG